VITLVDSFGVYYSAMVDKYNSSKAQVGWVLSMLWIFVFVAGDVLFYISLYYLCLDFGSKRNFICVKIWHKH